MVQPYIHDNESKRKMGKDTRCESFEQIDCRLSLQDARLDRSKTDNQTWGLGHFTGPHLRISSNNSPSRITTIPSIRVPNIHYTYRAMPFGTKHSPIYFATAMEPIMQQIRMKTEIGIINYVDDILLLHQNKVNLKNMTQQVINILKYFGFIMNMEKSETEPNQAVIFLGWEWNLANATVKTKPKKRLLLLHDLYNMRTRVRTGTEITVKQTAKLIGKLNYLRLQFQEASLLLNTMDHQKAQAARLRGWNTTMIMNKIAIPDIN
ncbi:MAG: hypothetical protein EZS28_023787 [Streblomastix strix]|uniref:Reverse transcriptase domain-containing protein n=1 Tax=Streblomastix strix TaxID=222440 RepID=A0A5J4VE16_9EUKA|nr:MAG: hypothetical protein EZS28_023787 [Streblomastix strix]